MSQISHNLHVLSSDLSLRHLTTQHLCIRKYEVFNWSGQKFCENFIFFFWSPKHDTITFFYDLLSR